MFENLSKFTTRTAVALTLGLAALPALAQSRSMSDSMFQGADSKPMMDMSDGMDMSDILRVPPVFGYSEGADIHFIHTEVSDPKIAQVLTDMMGSPVPVVASLADIPADLLARVYVFENGLQPDGPRGPLGFQPDIFDRPAGTDDYTPLRRIMLVNWSDGTEARILRSAEAVEMAETKDEISIKNSGIVVNIPFLTWPDGSR